MQPRRLESKWNDGRLVGRSWVVAKAKGLESEKKNNKNSRRIKEKIGGVQVVENADNIPGWFQMAIPISPPPFSSINYDLRQVLY